jgi:D-alanyl-D-alanine dipeptidase
LTARLSARAAALLLAGLSALVALAGPSGSASAAASGGSASPAASGGSASPTASGGSASPAASGGSASPAASGGSASPAASGGYGPEHLPAVADEADPLIDAAAAVPGLIVSLAYATPHNLTGRPLYAADTPCLLRRSVAGRLADAARALAAQHLRLVAWDCTRPQAVQEELWKAHPHAGAVADPARGSLHARGVAVDVALADLAGAPIALPTAFDAFGPAAAADAPLPDGPARAHRAALARAMREAGFRVNPKEWWHYSRLWGWRWPVAHPERFRPR